MLLTMNDGEQWDVNFLYPNYIGFCNVKNNKLSYSIILTDMQFYDALRKQCLSNELKFTPNAKMENIRLCTGGISKDPAFTRETVLPLVPE